MALSPFDQQWRQRYGLWAVVTGASDGIGREFAVQLAGHGLNLVLVARRESVLAELANSLAAGHGIQARALALDLAGPGAAQRLAAATGDLDVGLLAASAGFGTSGNFLEANLDQELEMIDVNCRAVAALSNLFGRRFARQGRGGIILMSSLLAFQGVPRAANYAATKAYVQTLAEGLSLELAPAGVDVLACAPGPVHTGFAARADMRMGMALKPADVARVTLSALGRRTTVRPGWLSKLLELSFTGMPRWGRSRILAQVMGGMTKHQQQDGKAKTQARGSA